MWRPRTGLLACLLYLVAGGIAAFIPLPSQARAEGETTPATLVQGILARADGVFSGEIEFRHETSLSTKKEPPNASDESCYFSGASWASFRPGTLVPAEISFRGKFVHYEEMPLEDGRIGRLARIKLEQPINYNYAHLPVFAGLFWKSATRHYIQKNLDKAVARGKMEVNGVSTYVLEWAVSEVDKFKAFGSVGPETEKGGVLRLYVAPQLGYVLPRVEILGTSGKVGDLQDSFDFFETAPGIFFPKRCRRRTYDLKGNYFESLFVLKKVEKINEPIPEDVFRITLPPGTTVVDSRSGVGSTTFKISEHGKLPVDGLEDLIQVGPPPSFWRRRWVAILLGSVAALLAIGAILVLRRWRRAKA